MRKGQSIKVLDHGYIKLIDYMGSDEHIIRAARQSTGKGFQGWDKDMRLLEYLYSNKHSTPFEMSDMIIEVYAPLFVFREWHRHRTQCLSGDTQIYFDLPGKSHEKYKTSIKNLYKIWNSTKNINKKDEIMAMKLRCLNEDTKEFTHTNITDVVQSGSKDVYKITTSDNRNIVCSADHKFLFGDNWLSLKDGTDLIHMKDNKIMWSKSSMIYVGGNQDKISKNKLKSDYCIAELVGIKKIEYLGKQECYDLSVAGPYHNFIANGIVTHNSFNEFSGRYSVMPDIHYLPSLERMSVQGKTNHQSSGDKMEADKANNILCTFKDEQENIYDNYQDALGLGLAKELARINTPLSRYSKMWAKANLRNWLAFLLLRKAPNAMYEIRCYADVVGEIIKYKWPRTYSLFEEHDFYGVRLGKMEAEYIKKLIAGKEDLSDVFINISKKDGEVVANKICKKIADKFGLAWPENNK